jgi:putative DNA primase/helicase
MPDLRPLAGAGALAAHPTLPVLLVFSPAAAMVANNFDLGLVTVAIPRAATPSETDFSPLEGREVTVWPDSGAAGLNMAESIAAAHSSFRILPPPPGTPDGWSLAEADATGWDAIRTQAYLTGADPITDPSGEPDVFSEPEPSAAAEPAADPGEAPFLMLGQTYGEFKYLSKKSQQITSLTASSHVKLNLLSLAPLDWWEGIWATKTGANWSAAANWMIQSSLAKPIFRPDRIRGRGCWIDDGRVIFHAGDRIITDGRSFPVSDFPTSFIYERNAPVDHDDSPPLPNADAAQFLALCDLLPWTMPIFSRFLAGWCVLAPICGALPWRPHGWLTGASGSGKTTAIVDVVSPALGSFRQKFLGATTEAGIRQNVRVDAIPIIMDEAESESDAGVRRMQGILDLIRQASSETGGVIAKGTVTGEASMFNVRSCFLLSSVGVAATTRPDASRITIMSLEKRHDPAAYARLIAQADLTTHNPAWCASLRARTRAQIPTILANSRHFISAATRRLGDARAGDQVGTLVAGAFSLTSTRSIDADFARSWVDDQDWTGFEPDVADTDENLAFVRLLQAHVRVDSTSGAPWTTTVGDLVEKFYARDRTADDASTATEVLRLYGMRIDHDGLCVSNTHAKVAEIYERSPWSGKWKDQLSRVPGAEGGRLIKFGESPNRCTFLPRRALVAPTPPVLPPIAPEPA